MEEKCIFFFKFKYKIKKLISHGTFNFNNTDKQISTNDLKFLLT
jgi:hypothetical protein